MGFTIPLRALAGFLHPGVTAALRLAVGFALDLVFPDDCVLCGERIPAGRTGRGGVRREPLPICPLCERGIRALEGNRCPRCGKILVSEAGLCMACRRDAGEGPEACTETLPIFHYANGVAALMAAYKSDGRRRLAGFWTAWLEPEIDARWPDFCIVPVPPRPEKLAAGGFDQVGALADGLERAGRPVCRPLRRVKGSAQQKRLGREARAANSRAAYVLVPGAAVPEKALLLDDVRTTGATLEACARLLVEAGARRVCALVLAAD